MVTKRLFDAFLWIEPRRASSSQPFSDTRVLWQYPSDVSSIAEFQNIPQFCFPDVSHRATDSLLNFLSNSRWS